MGILGIQQEKVARKNLEEADQLWSIGKKSDAVAKYKSVIDGHILVIPPSDRSTAFQRVIELEAEQGNTHYVKRLVREAADRNIPLSLNHPAARQILVQGQGEREAQGFAEAKRKEAEVAEKRSKYAWDISPETETKNTDNGGKPVQQNDSAPREVSRANYDKITIGMSLSQVESILGPGKESGSSVQIRIMNWSEGPRIISVTFAKGRVSSKVQVGL